MKQHRLLLLVLLLLLFSVGLVTAQSSSNYILQRFTLNSGGHSGSANYSVDSVIGQPATNLSMGDTYAVSTGFLLPSGLNQKVWLPMVTR